ncbi:MAG: carboxypeptidase regulatory-like domain-containing protein, partial [Acidobacteriaceae bacterium]|nr:carboxypeptidase regulatory-like domain-containing protein [Acidobacteriaceae bacterium]
MVALSLFGGCLWIGSAQETINYATVSGRVVDPTGKVVPGARVTARETEMNVIATTETDQDGRFRFPYLHVGSYEIGVEQDGFAKAVYQLKATVGAAFDLRIALAIASNQTNVTVNGEAAVLDNARTQLAETVSQAEINELPMNGRNFLDIALLTPAASPTNTASTQLFAETSAVPGQGISINSQRNFSNSFVVDGLSANDDAAGLVGSFYGLDVVNELQVVTSGGQAEFGRALAGYINIVTKSGTDSVHGDAYGFFRNQRLDAANALTNTNLPLTQAQYGASLGGPIVR